MGKIHHRVKIYKSKVHLLATLGFVAAPFLFLLIFSSATKIQSSVLFMDVAVSTVRLSIAYVISVVIAWVSAVLLFRGRLATVGLPLFDVLQSFPTFAALPLATYFWGASSITVIIFLVLTIIWPMFFSIISSLKMIRRDWEETAKIYGVNRYLFLRHFILPITLPGLITGSIVGLGEGWEALVATEIIVGMKTGLGSFFHAFAQNASVTIFGVLGFLVLIFSINKLMWLPLLEWSHNLMEE